MFGLKKQKSDDTDTKVTAEKKKRKKQTAELEPQYYMSATNMPVMNYNVYYFSILEKIGYFLAAFAVGAAVGYLFYAGIGKDEYGQATMLTHVLNIVIPVSVGLIAGKLFLPVRNQQIIDRNKGMLARQFRDMLDGLTTSLGAGNNIPNSFMSVQKDMKVQYEEGTFILQELDVIVEGFRNAIPIEQTLNDFGRRSGNDDIKSFANVFEVCNRQGGNIQDVIRNTHEILSDKMAVKEDIETVVTSSKNEQNMMLFMPVLLVGMIKLSSDDFGAYFATPVGVICTTFGVIMFIIAYFVGKKMLDIKL